MILYIVQAENQIAEISQGHPYKDTLKISASNFTIGIRVNWTDVEKLNSQNKSLELIIEANVTKFPSNMYQIPFLCFNNSTATTFTKDQKEQKIHYTAIQCDIYSYNTNQGTYRINATASEFQNETYFYASFYNLSGLSYYGNFTFDSKNELTDDNYWQVDFEIGIYQEQTKPLYCNQRGEYLAENNLCLCNKGFAGQYCEFQITALKSDFNDLVIIQPNQYAFFQFNYDELYDIILEVNNTASFNYFYIDQDDSEKYFLSKFRQTFFKSSQRVQSKGRKKQVLALQYNQTINSIVYWFKNDNLVPLEIEMQFIESKKLFLENIVQVLVNYIMYTFLAGFLLCGCGFLLVFCVMFLRKREMDKQLPKMTYLQFKSNTNFNRNDTQTMCSICLGEFSDQEYLRVTSCHHAFHNQCIEEWAISKNQCPVCRESIFTLVYSEFMGIFQRSHNRNNLESGQSVPVQVNNNNNNNSNNNNHIRYQNLVETH